MLTTFRNPSLQRGFAMMSALFILVVLAVLGAAIASISVRQQVGSAVELNTARAYQAARAGLEWGRVLRHDSRTTRCPSRGHAASLFCDEQYVFDWRDGRVCCECRVHADWPVE